MAYGFQRQIAPKYYHRIINDFQQEPRLNYYQIPENYSEFLKSCCRIRSGNRIIPFVPYDYQIELSRLVDKHRGIIIFKTRQMGITEAIAGKFLHKALLNPAYAAAVLSIGQKESSNVAVRIQNMPVLVDNLEFLSKNKTEVQPKYCGKVWFRPSTNDAARSFESISDLFFDEAAFPDNFEALYSASVPTQEAVGDAAHTIIASTMSELGELSQFWQMFASDNPCDAKEMVDRVKMGKEEPFTYWVDNSGWAKVIIHWRSHPVYSLIPNYLQQTKEKHKLTEDKLQREYNLGIPSSGGSLFSHTAISLCAVGMWQKPYPYRNYLVCVDPNFGGADNWITQVWDVTKLPYSLVFEYAENGQSTTKSLEQTALIAIAYDAKLIAIEGNSGGKIVVEQLSLVNTKTLTQKLTRGINNKPIFNLGRLGYVDLEIKKQSFRIETTITTQSTKKNNTDRIAIALEQQEIIVPPDWQGIEEMKRFSTLHRRAISGNDDRVMAWAAGWAWIDEVCNLSKTRTQVLPPQNLVQNFVGG